MFQVGKKYCGQAYDGSYAWECVAVVGDYAWLKCVGTNQHYPNNQIIHKWHNGWKEIPPEPKRWSRWVNAYKDGLIGCAHHYSYETREAAIRAGSAPGLRYVAQLARLDWEQQENQPAKLVKVEVEEV